MKKTTEKHFFIFRDECLRLQKAFGLLDWELGFGHIEMRGGTFADIRTTPAARFARLRLSTIWNDNDVSLTEKDIRDAAKHEMIHLLIQPLSAAAAERCINADELEEREHAVVQRLMYLLP